MSYKRRKDPRDKGFYLIFPEFSSSGYNLKQRCQSFIFWPRTMYIKDYEKRHKQLVRRLNETTRSRMENRISKG